MVSYLDVSLLLYEKSVCFHRLPSLFRAASHLPVPQICKVCSLKSRDLISSLPLGSWAPLYDHDYSQSCHSHIPRQFFIVNGHPLVQHPWLAHSGCLPRKLSELCWIASIPPCYSSNWQEASPLSKNQDLWHIDVTELLFWSSFIKSSWSVIHHCHPL